MSTTDETQRFRLFLEQEGLNTYSAAELLGTTQSNVAKYQTGTLKIPLKVVKTLHLKLRLNYTWFFHGNGPVKVKMQESKKLVHDVKDIEATIAGLIARQEKQEDTIRKLIKKIFMLEGNLSPDLRHEGDTKQQK